MENTATFLKKLKSYIIIGGIVAILFSFPPVFKIVFATDFLLDQEYNKLWIFTGILIVMVCLLKYKKGVGEKWFLFFLSLLLLIGLEFIARTCINLFAGENAKAEINKMAYWSYPEYQAYTGHPFLQYKGSSNTINNKINNFGFKDDDFTIEKPKNTIRIAALGGSTTESGYPQLMETYLNDHKRNNNVQFEVYNFGISGWTTAHSMSNFMLNVVDFKPDYVIIHHGWNDAIVRNTDPKFFRNDYSHILTTFKPPIAYDKYIVRVSALYRYLKWSLYGRPSWGALDLAMTSKSDPNTVTANFKNLEELKPFQRNIQHIINHAQLHNIKVILSTQPHTTNKETPLFFSALHIDQTNEIIKKISKKDSLLLFLDLDRQMTGKMDSVFLDLGHMNNKGMSYKAAQFGQVILEDMQQ